MAAATAGRGRGIRGVVATGHAAVSEAACRCLRLGGNACDAALAAGFAAAVAEPMFTSLGGGGFLLACSADGQERLVDFFVDTPGRGRPAGDWAPHFVPVTVRFPSSEQVFHAGLGSVAVPGTLRGFLHAHRSLGRLPLTEIVAPARELARDGVALNAHQAYVQGLLEPILTLTEAGRRLYTPAGRSLREGERFVNPELAAFLEALPGEGDGALYGGALAHRVEREMEGQGLLTVQDLAAYRVRERAPLAFSHGGNRVLTNPAPSRGGPLIQRTLALLEETGIGRHAWGSAEHLLALASVMEEIERLRAAPGAGGTTHISVCDAEGGAASLSLSNGEGSGYLLPGTGIMLNNMMGEDDLHPEGFHAHRPGERVGSMMSPTLVLRDGAVRLALGSGGSKRIRSAIVQVVSAVLDFGRGLRDAVEAPRIHWDGEQLQVEPGLSEAALSALAERFPLNRWDERNLYFGGVHAAEPGGQAAGDPRRQGHATVVER